MFQRSRLTFGISASRSYWSPIHILKHSVLINTRPIELKFYVKTTYDKLAKLYMNYFGHMTKMAATSIYGKKTFKSLLLKNQRANGQWHWDLVCSIGDMGPTKFVQMIILS